MDEKNRTTIAFISRTMPMYRMPIIEQFDVHIEADVFLICSKDMVPGEKAINFFDTSHVKTKLLKYKGGSIEIGNRRYPYGWFKKLFRTLDTIRPDVLVLEGESNFLNNVFLFFYCKVRSIPYIWWSCGRVRDQKESGVRKMLKPALGLLIKNASAVMGYSTYACRYFKETYGVSHRSTFVACNSLSRKKVEQNIRCLKKEMSRTRKELGISKGTPVLLYVGAVVREKNPDLFFNIYRQVKNVLPKTHAIFVGGGSYLDEMKRLSADVKDFHITGPIHENTERYFLASDVFIMPGLGGLALQQAMMCGLPVVCSVADGTELDLVRNGQNGYFIEQGSSIEVWSEKIIRIITDTEKRKKMGHASKKIIDTSFNSDIMINRMIDCINYSLGGT